MPVSVEFRSFISRAAWSANLTQEQLARVHKDAFERSYSAGAIVCHRGAPPDHWLGVIDGFVKVDTVSKEGRSTTLAGVPAGSWFGEGATLKDERRPYSVVALRDSKVGFIPRNTFEWLIDNSHSFSRFVIDKLNARCGYYVGLVGNLRLHKASARIAWTKGSSRLTSRRTFRQRRRGSWPSRRCRSPPTRSPIRSRRPPGRQSPPGTWWPRKTDLSTRRGGQASF